MGKFLLGFAAAVIVGLLAVFCYLRLGFVDPRADIDAGLLESKIAMPSLDAAVERHDPEAHNPLQPTEANLAAGMKIYQTNCASCHGDIHRPHAIFADALYPRAPQFVEDPPDMPEHENFYIVQHGIRLSGMPAWKQVLSEQEMWEVTTFLSHMDELPPQISAAWKMAAAGGSLDQSSSPNPSQMEMKDKKSMNMPMR